MDKIALFAAAGFAALTFNLAPAHATGMANRAWVSGKGTDASGCGAPTNACRSFQYVVSNIIAPGGEIDVLDPAGYGAVTIPFALSIVNDGVGTAGVQASSGDAITINAGTNDNITLRGLNIDGLGSGANGVVFNTGATLTIDNCVIRHFSATGGFFSGNAILLQPTSGSMSLNVFNVLASDNAGMGIFFFPPSGAPNVKVVVDHFTATNNNYGVLLNGYNISGGVVIASFSNTIASANTTAGMTFEAYAGIQKVSIDLSYIYENYTGIGAGTGTSIKLGRSVVTSNSYGVQNATSPNTFYTYGDNRINDNTTDIAGALNTAYKPQ